ncbi:hypothetical protein [Flavobacterium sp.]|uniref:hypothetical protein n=1 Tax=Flavobacterium sp. TaxID=239 RepID=UPI003A90230A
MALWQVSFFIIPKDELDSLTSLSNNKYGLFDDSNYWCNNSAPSVFNSLTVFLPLSKSWSDNIIQYGDLDSNVFEIGLRANKIESVSYRIDFRSDYETILKEIVEICLKNKFLILTNDLELMPLNYEGINAYILNSPQLVIYNGLSK